MVMPKRRTGGGFTYLGLLFAVALSSGALAVAASLWSTVAKRDREAQLLFAGDQIRAAITAYRDSAPVGQAQLFPKSFDDLLEDKRWPARRRHLRRVFSDPMTGTVDWGIVQAPDGGLMGVYSRSDAAPLKRGGFPVAYADFSEAGAYQDWRFVYTAPPEGAGDSRSRARPRPPP